MDEKEEEKKALTQTILQLIEEKRPQDVRQLIDMIKERTTLSEKQIIEHIVRLQGEGKIVLHKPYDQIPKLFVQYLTTRDAYWYWITIVLVAATALGALTIPDDAYPLVFLRYAFGAIFTAWFPGYTFIRLMFPSQPSVRARDKSSDFMERVALSVGMSLALVAIVGLLLNYTPWGIRPSPVIASLISLTVIFATVATIREHKAKRAQLSQDEK